MTNFQIDLFWEEVAQIQQRHSLFFPISQLKYIGLHEKDSNHSLIFLEGYNLSTAITQEIQLAFKLASDIKFECIFIVKLKSLRQSSII